MSKADENQQTFDAAINIITVAKCLNFLNKAIGMN